ncbi:hypothetical protein PABG_02437 [Paracoccidioides brasiliensis Pb03]|nr:hypothetical protein PABG_02437 [Paracoccidioides brasiliensis Pb03]
MTDMPSTGQPMPGDIMDPPTKRPCLEPVSNGFELGETPVDDGSDFYNTPLNAGSPVNNAQSWGAEDSNTTVAPTPLKPTPTIPGLGFLNGDNATVAPQGNGSADRGGIVKSASSGFKPAETSRECNQRITPPDDVKMGDTSPVVQQHEGEVQDQNHTFSEESKPNAITAISTTDSEPISPTQNGVSGGLSGGAPRNTGGAEIGPDDSENPEWEMDSSPYESSSSSSSSDGSDDEDSSEEYDLLDPEEQARILMATEGASDDEGDGKHKGGQVRTANEKPEEIVPKPDITVTPDMKVEVLGNVETIVENVVLIKANISGEYQVLESGSVLCLADLSVIGVVSETLGRVEQPLYTVRFPNEESIKAANLERGTPVFYVMDHSTFVFTQPLKGLKGSDASNFHDEEVGDEEIEFSDDEAEAEYKRLLKQKRQQKKDGRRDANGHGKLRRDLPGLSKLRNSELNYDDVGAEEGYTPLSRPNNYHKMIGYGEGPLEESQPRKQFAERASRGGGGRGVDRGGRGRGRGGGHQKHRDDRLQQQSRPQPQSEKQLQQEPSQSNYPPQSAEFHPPQTSHQSQNPYQQQSPYNLPFYPPYQYQQPNHTPQMYNTNQAFFPFHSPPAQQSLSFQSSQQAQASPFPPPGSHINPAFFPNFQQQQQQQNQPPTQQGAYSTQASSNQSSADTFAAAQAQLDLLRRLRTGGS